MYLQNLPLELLFKIIADLPDPCDLKSLYSASKRLYTLLLPTFNTRYSHVQHDVVNTGRTGYEWFNKTKPVDTEDPVLHQKQLKQKVLAFIATKNGWGRLVRSLVRDHGVSGSNTVHLRVNSLQLDREISIIEIAARKGDYDLVEFLLDHGSDPNCRTFVNINTLEREYIPSTPLLAAAATNNVDIISLLLRRGAELEFDSVSYYQLVGVAVQKGNTEVLNLLLNLRSNLNQI